MVREVTFKVYQFDELLEEVKEKVLDDCRFIMVEYFNWWEFVNEDAENIGLEIVEFDLNRRYIRMKLKENILSSIEEALNLFNKDSNEYKIAKSYYDEIMKLADSDEVKEYLEENPDDDAYDAIYNMSLDDKFYDEYVKDMSRFFLKMLEEEFKYLTSDEAIIEMFEANDYEFFETGKVFNAMEFVLNS